MPVKTGIADDSYLTREWERDIRMSEITKLISRLDWNCPSLADVGKYQEQSRPDAAMKAVIQHFATRTAPRYLFKRDELGKCGDSRVLQDAEDVMSHKIYGYQFPGDIDWTFNPTEHTSHDDEWSWSLYRTIYWQPLIRAYGVTGDDKYVREFVSQLKSFSRQWPAEPFINDTVSPEVKNAFPGHAWRTIEAGIRIYTTWLPCFESFRRSPAWDPEGWVVFLNEIVDHATFLMGHYSNHSSSSNWLTMESSALLQMGILFPELKGSREWFETGYRRVMHELKYSFDNDGIHMERTPIYHLVASNAFLQAWRMCVLNDIPVPPYALPTLEKSAEFIMRLVKPDFSTPMIGDADRDDLLARRSDTSVYEGMNLSFDPVDLNEMRAYFRTMSEITGREDFRYFASGRKEGSPPEERNYPMVGAGIYVMRTGWNPDDSYFHVQGIQLERGERSTHSHNDQCHLELMIHGEDILIDTGRYIYNRSCWKDWRHYFTFACAHNTVYIDDHEMGTVPGVARVRGVRTYCHRFEETGDFRVIDLSHNGYVFMDDSIFHRRRVIGLDGDIYVIDDQLTGLGKQPHDIRLYFNFAPGRLESTGDYTYAYTTPRGTAYQLTSILNDGLTPVLLEGSENPIGGWVSYGYSLRTPAPQLHFETQAAVPLRFVTVIAPKGVACRGSGNMDGVRLQFDGKAGFSLEINGEQITRKGLKRT